MMTATKMTGGYGPSAARAAVSFSSAIPQQKMAT